MRRLLPQPKIGVRTLSALNAAISDADVPPETRAINTQHSLSGGGNLSADRVLSLVGDVESPGANMVYGTDNAGTRGWKDDPAGDTGDQTAYRHRVAGTDHLGSQATANSGTRAISANHLFALPIYFGQAKGVDTIVFNVATAAGAGALARVGLYEDDGSLYPGSLLVDGGTVAVDSTGYKVVTFESVTTPANKVVWLAIVSDSTPTLSTAVGTRSDFLGAATLAQGRHNWGYRVNFTFDALPATYPAGANFQNTTQPGNPWFLALRVS